ncbi:hypothetical protein [Iodobacter ciconiae]|uniref:Calcium-binding protein n=1 Tax=Iodobacter ciconiae TaxID=2496266 RepID=A0A3S8ZWE0_9NEIS|nr:hypothetical protein [Iodobacter ciconiae]AZN37813.1 hypothetical protein EJO50_15885 [Iodobacter ciconiae]
MINGSAFADLITGGEGADTVTGAAGKDSIVLTETTSAVDTLKYSESGVLNADTVTGFKAGTDIVSITIGNITDNGGLFDTLSNAAGGDISAGVAAGAAVASFTGASSTGTLLANTVNLVILSNVAATSFATAIGTTTFTSSVGMDSGLTLGEGLATVWFDATNSQAVYGYIENSIGAGDILSTSDTFHEIVRVGMVAADFTQGNITASFSLF